MSLDTWSIIISIAKVLFTVISTAFAFWPILCASKLPAATLDEAQQSKAEAKKRRRTTAWLAVAATSLIVGEVGGIVVNYRKDQINVVKADRDKIEARVLAEHSAARASRPFTDFPVDWALRLPSSDLDRDTELIRKTVASRGKHVISADLPFADYLDFEPLSVTIYPKGPEWKQADWRFDKKTDNKHRFASSFKSESELFFYPSSGAKSILTKGVTTVVSLYDVPGAHVMVLAPKVPDPEAELIITFNIPGVGYHEARCRQTVDYGNGAAAWKGDVTPNPVIPISKTGGIVAIQ